MYASKLKELLEQYLMRGRAYILTYLHNTTVKKTDILEDTQTENL